MCQYHYAREKGWFRIWLRSLGGKLSSNKITMFIKQRTMIRLNYLNYILDQKNTTRKRRVECSEIDNNSQKNKELKKIIA
jgi:hypothetical protein